LKLPWAIHPTHPKHPNTHAATNEKHKSLLLT
jgi:hypothetical protein